MPSRSAFPSGCSGPIGSTRERSGPGCFSSAPSEDLGLWWLYDLILIAAGEFRDEEGRKIRQWDPGDPVALGAGVSSELIEEVEALRREVTDLSERVDFTERLLSDPDRRTPPASGFGS